MVWVVCYYNKHTSIVCQSIVCLTIPLGLHMGKRRGFDSVLNERHAPRVGNVTRPSI